MTIRAMAWFVALLLLASVYLVACGRPSDLSDEQADRIAAAEEDAARATETVEALEDDVRALTADLAASESEAIDRARRVSVRLDRLNDRLTKGVGKLRAALSSAEGASADASANASAALGQVQSVVRDLSVLRARYDQHLLRFHGGG